MFKPHFSKKLFASLVIVGFLGMPQQAWAGTTMGYVAPSGGGDGGGGFTLGQIDDSVGGGYSGFSRGYVYHAPYVPELIPVPDRVSPGIQVQTYQWPEPSMLPEQPAPVGLKAHEQSL